MATFFMPLTMMEKYLYPALYLMQYLQDNADEKLPGGMIEIAKNGGLL
jgi:hypothetical protein